MRILLSSYLVAVVVAAHPAWGQCSISAQVTKGTNRPDGNHVKGYSVAWASSGDWWNWTARAYGTFYFTPLGGAPQQLASGSGSGALSNGDYTNPNNPQWSNTTDLDSKGNGNYYATGHGDFFSLCGDQYYGVLYGQSPNRPVNRPTITGPNPAQNSWAFWYLGGAPSTDGYYVQATLQGNANWSPERQGQTLNMTWQATPNKVSFTTTNASTTSTTTTTSTGASDGMVYDVKVVFKVDGFSSVDFQMHINKPVHLNFPSSLLSFASSTGCPGYETPIYYTGRDLWENQLIEITTNEQFSNFINGNTPPITGWGTPSAGVWHPGNRNEWIDSYTFKDTIWAYDCGSTWNPRPQAPQGGTSLVRSATQRIYMGSGLNGSGAQVQTGTMQWYTDHGSLQ
ncbi:MAG: hypothetical protein SFV54_10805 [Bryobacteraceae bacterium]|nr:hypothetical protein [Bryobacteraceae bacterium]